MFSSNFSHANLIPFQSTLPMQGATFHSTLQPAQVRKVSIHTPHAGSDETTDDDLSKALVSIHTPHAGSDRNIVYYELIKSVYIVLDMIC